MNCTPTFPLRNLHVTHFDTILSTLSVIFLPLCAAFWWHHFTIIFVIFSVLDRRTGCTAPNSKDDFPNLPPTLIKPFLSINGFKYPRLFSTLWLTFTDKASELLLLLLSGLQPATFLFRVSYSTSLEWFWWTLLPKPPPLPSFSNWTMWSAMLTEYPPLSCWHLLQLSSLVQDHHWCC